MNSVWASLLVEELVRNGIDYFCISPGSRSTPLVAAVASHPKARTLVHFDERGSAFHALGYARATGRPAVVICTSGTAVANFLPAVVEASMDNVPMVLLTADRPPELRDTGANQTIDQVGIFSSYTRWMFNLPCPDPQIDPRLPLTTVDQAVSRTSGSPSGPVHLNCMFREPLAPTPTGELFDTYLEPLAIWSAGPEPFTTYRPAEQLISTDEINSLRARLRRARRGLLIIGALKRETEREAVTQFSNAIGWPAIPDILSGLKTGSHLSCAVDESDFLLASEKFRDVHQPDFVLHIGGRATSTRLFTHLEQCRPIEYIHISDCPSRLDPFHLVTGRYVGDIAKICDALANGDATANNGEWAASFTKASCSASRLVDEMLCQSEHLSEAAVARALSRRIEPDTALFVASSMPVRDLDLFAAPDGPSVPVAGNRGASGIDGTIASAAGYAMGLGKPVTLLIGDLAFLHDLNSLAILRSLSQAVTVVVINNNGGGIFSHLPIEQHKAIFEEYFVTPHGMQFHDIAAQFGLHYHCPHDLAHFEEIFMRMQRSRESSIIELLIDRDASLAIHRKIKQAIIDHCQSH